MVFHCSQSGRQETLSAGAPLPSCLCFPMTMWATHGNGRHIAFVWEYLDMTYRSDCTPGFVPSGEPLFVVKTPSLFVYLCY